MNPLDTIARCESEVRSYVRSFPTVFASASGAWLVNDEGRRFLDFFAGAGTLNYGHNPPAVKTALIEYLQSDGVMHSLDLATTAKVRFLKTIERYVLQPRDLNYKVQFVGPTGTNAVEAAIKLARKVTGRPHVIAFTGGYHGHSLGALALTSNRYYHDDSFGARHNVSHLPYDGYLGDFDTAELLEKALRDPSSGVPLPAAVIVEPLQGEGGVRVASPQWLRRIADICKQYGAMLICDEIQVGNGRTGDYFAFEQAGIHPDIVCVSKSLGGGLPLALNLIRPEIDVWKPGQHTGTFRGNNLAFVAGATLLETYWNDDRLQRQITAHEQTIAAALQQLASKYPQAIRAVRGRGMIWGIEFAPAELAGHVSHAAFENGLLMETCGSEDQVIKLLPPLVIDQQDLRHGLDIIAQSVAEVLGPPQPPQANKQSVIGALSSTMVTSHLLWPSSLEASIDVVSDLAQSLTTTMPAEMVKAAEAAVRELAEDDDGVDTAEAVEIVEVSEVAEIAEVVEIAEIAEVVEVAEAAEVIEVTEIADPQDDLVVDGEATCVDDEPWVEDSVVTIDNESGGNFLP